MSLTLPKASIQDPKDVVYRLAQIVVSGRGGPAEGHAYRLAGELGLTPDLWVEVERQLEIAGSS